MLLTTIIFFLIAGLYLLGEAVRRLWLMEWKQMNPALLTTEPDEDKDKTEEEGPKLTKLGRPVTEIKLSA